MAKVYAQIKKVSDLTLVTAVAGEYEDITIDESWIQIDSGRGAKYSYASTKYLAGPIKDENGYYRYKFIENNGVYECSADDIQKQKDAEKHGGSDAPKPSEDVDKNTIFPLFLYADGLKNDIRLEEVSDEKLRTGENFTFIALFNNDLNAPTTINKVITYLQGTKNNPEFRENCAYTIWYSETDSCFYVKNLNLIKGTAVESQVLENATFCSSKGINLKGTMPNIGKVSANLNCGQSFTIQKGYHDGTGIVSANSLASQTQANATPETILKGYSAFVNGVKVQGNMERGFTSVIGTAKMDRKRGIVTVPFTPIYAIAMAEETLDEVDHDTLCISSNILLPILCEDDQLGTGVLTECIAGVSLNRERGTNQDYSASINGNTVTFKFGLHFSGRRFSYLIIGK